MCDYYTMLLKYKICEVCVVNFNTNNIHIYIHIYILRPLQKKNYTLLRYNEEVPFKVGRVTNFPMMLYCSHMQLLKFNMDYLLPTVLYQLSS